MLNYALFRLFEFSNLVFPLAKERERERGRGIASLKTEATNRVSKRESGGRTVGGLCLRRYRYNVASRCSFPAAVPPIYRTLDPLSTFPFRARGETFPGKFQRPKAPASVTSSAINRVDTTRRYPPALYIPSILHTRPPADIFLCFISLQAPLKINRQPADGWISPLLTRVYGHGWPVSRFRKVERSGE